MAAERLELQYYIFKVVHIPDVEQGIYCRPIFQSAWNDTALRHGYWYASTVLLILRSAAVIPRPRRAGNHHCGFERCWYVIPSASISFPAVLSVNSDPCVTEDACGEWPRHHLTCPLIPPWWVLTKQVFVYGENDFQSALQGCFQCIELGTIDTDYCIVKLSMVIWKQWQEKYTQNHFGPRFCTFRAPIVWWQHRLKSIQDALA